MFVSLCITILGYRMSAAEAFVLTLHGKLIYLQLLDIHVCSQIPTEQSTIK